MMKKLECFFSFQRKTIFNTLLLTTLLIVFSFNSFSQKISNNQYTEISGAELESKIFQNHQAGSSGYNGLINNLEFKVEDFSLLKSKVKEISDLLNVQIETLDFYLNEDDNLLIVNYDKSLANTKEFLATLKEVLYSKGVLLVDYTEKTTIKN